MSTDPRPYVVEDGRHLALHFDDRAVQSVMSKRDPFELVLYPTQVMMWGVLLCPRPESIAIVGLGGGSLAKWLWRYLPSACVQVAEIDAEVIGIARRHFGVPPDGERFAVLHEDGASLVARLHRAVDLLVVDGFDTAGIPAQLATPDFDDACWSSLADSGVAVFNLDAGPASEARIRRIARRFRGICWSITSPANGQTIVFAQRGGDDLSPLRDYRIEARARELAGGCDLDLRPALDLFVSGWGDGEIVAWGRLWRCQRLINPLA